jgi:hypothetical protein
MTGPVTRWRTDDPCPVCGTGLIATEDADGNQIGQDCRLGGWSATWQAGLDFTAPDLAREA